MKGLLTIYLQSAKSLIAKPMFTITTIVTLGISLGVLLSVISLNYLLFVEPLPYPGQNKLYVIEQAYTNPQKDKEYGFSYGSWVHVYKNQEGFDDMALIDVQVNILVEHPAQPKIQLSHVSPEYFTIFGVPMEKGRFFSDSEALDTHNPVAVISYDTWKNYFNLREDILDQSFLLSGVGTRFRIVGVVSREFEEPMLNEVGAHSDVWMPLDYGGLSSLKDNWGDKIENIHMIGKLGDTSSLAQVQQRVSNILSTKWDQEVGTTNVSYAHKKTELAIVSLKDALIGNSGYIALILLGAVVGLISIALGNMSNLFISRISEQQQNLAIRAALGATKKSLYKEMAIECSVLMFAAVPFALVITAFGFGIMQFYFADLFPKADALAVNGMTIVINLLIAVIFTALFAKVRISFLNYAVLNNSLQSSGKNTGVQVSQKTRNILVSSQVTLALVLLFASALVYISAVKVVDAPKGYDTTDVYSAYFANSSAESMNMDELISIARQYKEKLLLHPKIENVSRSQTPLEDIGEGEFTYVASDMKYSAAFKKVDHQYFKVMSQTLLKGEYFSEDDIRNMTQVMIVNDVFAKKLDPNGDVVGKEVLFGGGKPWKIVGVVNNVVLAHGKPGVSRVYMPASESGSNFLIKYRDKQQLSRSELVAYISQINPRYAVFFYQPLDELQNKMLFLEITASVTSMAIAIFVIVLSIIGLYGVMSISINMRRTEIGVRMAIGATGKQIIHMVLKSNVYPVMYALIASSFILLLSFYGLRGMSSNVISVQLIPIALVTIIATVSMLVLACYWPLRLLIKQTPINCLRDE